MAIWTCVYGGNGLALTRNLSDEHYLNILNNIPLDEKIILDGVIEVLMGHWQPSYADAIKRRDEALEEVKALQDKFVSGLKSNWSKIDDGFYGNNLQERDVYSGLRFHINNDIISLFGPDLIFSNNGNFQGGLSVKTRDYYHKYFKTILKNFHSEFILYVPEWYGISDGDSETNNINDLLSLENWREKSSESIQSMDQVYFESL